ncbi:MAG: 50S ribosomal protein L15 [Elusimicrobia bacterium RIFCSPLOWO2_01_FULL_64_13]|nr:MAG: 50S ribosomal protein L15 [Elusimicrobia bacterium RIFCSPHIGHO2_01_FULL_64_10]OGR95410.1 MAG: 50S ribosomal protein L15 [Elusimicrobia bacterium RIFCSPLOWO2_01_FULL_64_13]
MKQKAELSLSNLRPADGSRHRRKIVGRGVGSGHGRHATRGMKGQRSRSGDGKMIGFEGGQIPLIRRIPKRGFTPPFPERNSVVNVAELGKRFGPNSEVTPQVLAEEGLVRSNRAVKVLGEGEITKPLKVSAQSFSEKAKAKILAAGGTVTVL